MMPATIDRESHCTTVQDGYAECTCGWRSVRVFWNAERLAMWHRLSISEAIDNPYLHAFLAPIADAEVTELGTFGSMFMRRDRLTAEYAWAIPTEIVLTLLAELSPICDLGCGTGYWARLLTDVGAHVIAVDANPPLEKANHWHRSEAGLTKQPAVIRHFTDIIRGDAATFDVPADHTLMLCWPPRDNMAAEALARYQGNHVIYVGEYDGCTGNDTFHEMLAVQWNQVACYRIPQWEGLHDDVRVYARKSA
jgi:SAM-dependent methyltransferase